MYIYTRHFLPVFLGLLPVAAFGFTLQSDSVLIFEENFGSLDVSELKLQVLPGDIYIYSHSSEEISLEVRLTSVEFGKDHLGILSEEIDLQWSVENGTLTISVLPDDAPALWWRSTAPFFLDRRVVLHAILRTPKWMNLELNHIAGMVSLGEHEGNLDLKLESGVFKASFLYGENNLHLSRSKAEISFFRKGRISASQSEIDINSAPLLILEANDFDISIEQTGQLAYCDLKNGSLRIGTAVFTDCTSQNTALEFEFSDRLEINSFNDSIFIASSGTSMDVELLHSFFSVAGNCPHLNEYEYKIDATDSELLLFVDAGIEMAIKADVFNSSVQWPGKRKTPKSESWSELTVISGHGTERRLNLSLGLKDSHFILLR